VGEGAVEVRNRKHALAGIVVPAGRPGRLADVRRLAAVAPGSAKVPRILAGQHQHLPPPAQDDMAWLAATAGIDLSGRVEIYERVKKLL
jgi:hypothetical protein